MNRVDWMGWLHAALGVAALGLGLAMVLRRKGTPVHRRTGRLYAVTLLLLNVTALTIYDLFGFFGPFHMAAVISLATLAAGIFPMYFLRPRKGWIELHAHFMAWSYAGLVAAFAAELAVRLPFFAFGPAVLWATVVVLAGAAVIIYTRVPKIIRAFGGSQKPKVATPEGGIHGSSHSA